VLIVARLSSGFPDLSRAEEEWGTPEVDFPEVLETRAYHDTFSFRSDRPKIL